MAGPLGWVEGCGCGCKHEPTVPISSGQPVAQGQQPPVASPSGLPPLKQQQVASLLLHHFAPRSHLLRSRREASGSWTDGLEIIRHSDAPASHRRGWLQRRGLARVPHNAFSRCSCHPKPPTRRMRTKALGWVVASDGLRLGREGSWRQLRLE